MTATVELRRDEMSAVDLLRQIDEHARWELGRSAAELKTRIDRIFAGPPPSVVPERWPTPKHVTTWQNWPHRLALALMPDANDAAPVAGHVYDQKRGWVPKRPEPTELSAERRQRQRVLAAAIAERAERSGSEPEPPWWRRPATWTRDWWKQVWP